MREPPPGMAAIASGVTPVSSVLKFSAAPRSTCVTRTCGAVHEPAVAFEQVPAHIPVAPPGDAPPLEDIPPTPGAFPPFAVVPPFEEPPFDAPPLEAPPFIAVPPAAAPPPATAPLVPARFGAPPLGDAPEEPAAPPELVVPPLAGGDEEPPPPL